MQRRKRILKAPIKYVAVQLLPSISMVKAVGVAFQPKKWNVNVRSTMWALEMVAGYVALPCMSVYWPAYADFRIPVNNSYVGAVYQGWNLGLSSAVILIVLPFDLFF